MFDETWKSSQVSRFDLGCRVQAVPCEAAVSCCLHRDEIVTYELESCQQAAEHGGGLP
jgi:hypothetical protein